MSETIHEGTSDGNFSAIICESGSMKQVKKFLEFMPLLYKIMNQDQIAKEYHKLLVEQMKNLTENECFMKFEIELSKRIRSLDDELIAGKDVEEPSEDEQYLHDVRQMQKIYQIGVHNELLAIVKRLTDKSTRRMNESKKKMEQFCKRHGLNENGTMKAES